MQKVMGSKVLLFSVVFFFMGMVSSSAQYVGSTQAINILKGEVATLEAQIPGASNQQLINLHFKMSYYKFIVWDIQSGSEVGAAINNNKPHGKFKLLGTMGLAVPNKDASVKQEITALVAYVDELLSI